MPRKIQEPYVQWKISLPATVAARVERRYFDPTLGKPRYAERSKLITTLLETWLSTIEGHSYASAPPTPLAPPSTLDRPNVPLPHPSGRRDEP